jgi:hypothetical protein
VVEHTIGNGEVDSSILSSSTTPHSWPSPDALTILRIDDAAIAIVIWARGRYKRVATQTKPLCDRQGFRCTATIEVALDMRV